MSGPCRASFLALGLVLACGPTPSATTQAGASPSSPSGPERAPESSGFDGAAGEWEAREAGLRLRLPDRAGWSELASKDWVVLQHPRAHASFRLRLTRAARLVTPNECLDDARLRDPELPVLDEEEVVERRALVAPDHFSGEVVLGVREAGPSVHGYAVARGAAIGKCYVAVFESAASGAGRESVIAARLRAIAQSLDSVEVPSVEDRLGR